MCTIQQFRTYIIMLIRALYIAAIQHNIATQTYVDKYIYRYIEKYCK